MHLGVMRLEDQTGLAAHAWLTLGRLTVVGGAGRTAYVEVAQFG